MCLTAADDKFFHLETLGVEECDVMFMHERAARRGVGGKITRERLTKLNAKGCKQISGVK